MRFHPFCQRGVDEAPGGLHVLRVASTSISVIGSELDTHLEVVIVEPCKPFTLFSEPAASRASKNVTTGELELEPTEQWHEPRSSANAYKRDRPEVIAQPAE